MTQQDEETTPIADFQYVGFLPRVGASLIDTILLMLVSLPLLVAAYGWGYFTDETPVKGVTDVLVNYLLPITAILSFWIIKQATPGKMAIHAVIVDANSGQKPTTKQFVIRYFGYIVATIPLLLGILWVAWDKRKQGWHDKLAGTVVVCQDD